MSWPLLTQVTTPEVTPLMTSQTRSKSIIPIIVSRVYIHWICLKLDGCVLYIVQNPLTALTASRVATLTTNSACVLTDTRLITPHTVLVNKLTDHYVEKQSAKTEENKEADRQTKYKI